MGLTESKPVQEEVKENFRNRSQPVIKNQVLKLLISEETSESVPELLESIKSISLEKYRRSSGRNSRGCY